jgi:multidrug efflux pump subunit AcrA (membrane-fusion protein)
MEPSLKYLKIILPASIAIALLAFFLLNSQNVETLSPKSGDVVEAIYGLGKVKTDKVFEVKTGIVTNITDLLVKEGDVVKKGTKLISFAETASFYAPFDGTVTAINYQLGELVPPSTPIIRLENLEHKYIEVSLEQEAALKVRKGQKAQINFESQSNIMLNGIVQNIYAKKGEFITHIDVENLGENILPGMTADVVIEVGNIKDVLLIPASSISSGFVTRKRDGKKSKIEVKTGHSDGAWVQLLEGDIKLTDELIIKSK